MALLSWLKSQGNVLKPGWLQVNPTVFDLVSATARPTVFPAKTERQRLNRARLSSSAAVLSFDAPGVRCTFHQGRLEP